jgi:hypothetical protein
MYVEILSGDKISAVKMYDDLVTFCTSFFINNFHFERKEVEDQ